MTVGALLNIEVEPGVMLAVEDGHPTQGGTVVLSNSIGSDFGMWDEVTKVLANHFRIVRYDTRGHGRSDLGSNPVTLERLGLDVIHIMDALKIDRAVFCGLSLGGLTGQWLGAAFPDRLDGLVLANTAPNFPPPKLWLDRAATVRERGMDELVGPTLDRWLTQGFRTRYPARTAEIARMVASTPAEGYARCCEVLAAADVAPMLPRISVPVRVICGHHDPSTTPARGVEIIASTTDADLVTLEAGHLSAVEASEAFVQAILEFLKRTTSAQRRESRSVQSDFG
jgi:3-oxoadipate enol-lactonase